ncbi:MAG TPA: hypothetical protein VHS99_12125, partial [Chloroflexota bacterium]|nr:hypothetical protein [Chloroflexota bacterium]
MPRNRPRRRRTALTATAALAAAAFGPPPAAPGPPPGTRLIFTYYYYWYDSQSGAHLEEAGGLRHHFPQPPAPDWRSAEWHGRQLMDMRYAGIDVVLPVYWGFVNTNHADDEWSWNGLLALARTWQSLKSQGLNPPHIGLFFDTTIVAGRDLTTAAGKEWFYANFRDFFTRVPREQWALVQGRPVAFLFTSD